MIIKLTCLWEFGGRGQYEIPLLFPLPSFFFFLNRLFHFLSFVLCQSIHFVRTLLPYLERIPSQMLLESSSQVRQQRLDFCYVNYDILATWYFGIHFSLHCWWWANRMKLYGKSINIWSANWFHHKFLERVALQGASHGRKIALLDVSLGTSEHGLVGLHITERQNSFPRTYLKIYIWFPLTLLLKTEIHTRKDGYSLEWIRIWIITFLK